MNKTLIVLVAVGTAAVGVLLWYAATHSALFIANGLPVPVQVSLDGQAAVTIGAADYVSLGEQAHGLRVIEVRLGDVVIERQTVGLSTVSVFNILGVAPIAIDTVTYTASSAVGVSPETSFRCNVMLVTDRVDYLFQQPPRSIQLQKGSSMERRTVMRLVPGGYGACLDQSAPDQLAELAGRIAKALPDQAGLKETELHALVRAGKAERALVEARELAAASNGVESHRTLQHVLIGAGKRQVAVAEYEERYTREPTPENLYLWARLLDAERAVPVLKQAVERWPDDTRLHRSLAWNLDALSLWADSLAESTRALRGRRGDEPQDPVALKLQVRALVALGRADDALTSLSASLGDDADLDDLAMLDRVARLAGREPTPSAWDRFKKGRTSVTPHLRFFFDVMVGREPTASPSIDEIDGLKCLVALEKGDPAVALAAFRPRNFVAATPLTGEAAFLLLGEAWRNGAGPASAGLERSMSVFPMLDEVRSFVWAGDHADALNDLPGEMRAALWLARARTLDAHGQVELAKQAFDQVIKADPLHGLAVSASRSWPPVKPMQKAMGAFELRLLPGVVLTPAGSK